MRSSDVFQATGESRLTQLLMDGPVDQSKNLDRLLNTLEGIEADLVEIRERLSLAEDRSLTPTIVGANLPDESPEPQSSEYVVYLSTPEGYRLFTHHGPVPASGDTLDDAGASKVLNVGRSPLPNDPRPCVFAL